MKTRKKFLFESKIERRINGRAEEVKFRREVNREGEGACNLLFRNKLEERDGQ